MRRVSNAELSLAEKSGDQDPLTHPDTAADARRFLALSRQTESSYSRNYKELIDLQTARALRNMEAELPPLALSFKIASFLKQTQANRLRDIDIEWKSGDIEVQRWMKADRERRHAHAEPAKTEPVQRVAEQSQPKVETIVRDTPKVGRNEPCPCGSGQKFKRCCGNPLRQTLAQTA
jgi:preprotein translocase subunit SecA